MRGWLFTFGLILSALGAGEFACAGEIPSLEAAAAQAQSCIATVRVLDAAPENTENARPRVTVCTGVCVEKGWVVTPAFASSDSQIRLTLPGGQQSPGRLRVIDEYSGLSLVEADTKELTPLKPAAAPVNVGAWVLSAAAWGVEKPVISFGILSGHDRTAGGMQYPPLLQADLKTTETSSGAALLSARGELLGIVVLVDDGKDRHGFSFAVPASHVQRLLRARVERPALDKPMPSTESSPAVSEPNRDRRLEDVGTSVVVLKRRRPIVGMVLDGIGESVVIKRIEKNSPADKAGLKVGDVVQAVEGIRIRSVYQAVTPVLYKQPGDIVAYEVLQGQTARRVEVTLGGGVELPSAPAELLGSFIRPKVDIEGVGKGLYYTRSANRNEVREVAAPGETPLASDEKKLNSSAEQILLLEKALDSYRAVITYQQGQLSQRDGEQRAAEEQIKRLEAQLEKLKALQTNPTR